MTIQHAVTMQTHGGPCPLLPTVMELQRPQGAWSSSSLGADAILGADAWLNAHRVSRSLLWRPQGPEEGPGKAAPLGGSGP